MSCMGSLNLIFNATSFFQILIFLGEVALCLNWAIIADILLVSIFSSRYFYAPCCLDLWSVCFHATHFSVIHKFLALIIHVCVPCRKSFLICQIYDIDL